MSVMQDGRDDTPDNQLAEVNVAINNRQYRIACRPGEEDHLCALAERFNRTIETLREQVGEVGDMRLLVMAGIVMADRLTDQERNSVERDRQEALLRADHAQQLGHYQREREALRGAIEKTTRRMETLGAMLSQVIRPGAPHQTEQAK